MWVVNYRGEIQALKAASVASLDIVFAALGKTLAWGPDVCCRI